MREHSAQATTARDIGLLIVAGFALLCGMSLMVVGRAFAQTVPAITGPSVSAITETSATVSWTVVPASTGQVEFGETLSLGSTFRNIVAIEETEVISTSHDIWLFELKPGTTYYYRVRSATSDGGVALSNIQTFTTKATAALIVAPVPVAEPAPAPAVDTVVSDVSKPQLEVIKVPTPVEVPVPVIATKKVESSKNDRPEEAPGGSSVVFVGATPGTMSDKPMEGFSVGLHLFAKRDADQPQMVSSELAADISEYTKVVGDDPNGALLGGTLGSTEVRGYAELLCQQNFIHPDACVSWLIGEFADESCRNAGILTKHACVAYLTQRNGGMFDGCAKLDPIECDQRKILATIDLLPDDQLADVDRIIAQAGKDQVLVSLPQLTSIKPDHIGKARWWKSPRKDGQQTALGMVVLDADLDGLPDDYERSIGTDPDRADTDKDGIDDIIELQKGTDPKGPGKLGRDLALSEKTIVFRKPLEQPAAKADADASMTLAVNGSSNGLKGTCEAGQTCILYLYSYIPMVLTTTADASGHWSYDLSDAMTNGHHTVYVAVTDDTGKIIKRSNPLSFFVNEAKAVTFDEFVAASAEPIGTAVQGTPEQAFSKYLYGVVVLAVLAVILALAVLRKQPASIGME